MYERVLVALKSDPSDEQIVAHAADLAALAGSRLTLLHAVHSHSRDAGAFLEQEATAYLEEMAGPIRARGIETEVMVVPGEPAETIQTVAAQTGAELLVMGTHGHHQVRHVLLGSVTESVIRGCSVPALLIRP